MSNNFNNQMYYNRQYNNGNSGNYIDPNFINNRAPKMVYNNTPIIDKNIRSNCIPLTINKNKKNIKKKLKIIDVIKKIRDCYGKKDILNMTCGRTAITLLRIKEIVDIYLKK